MGIILILSLVLSALVVPPWLPAANVPGSDSERYNEPTLAITINSGETTTEEQPMAKGASIRDGAMHWNVEMGVPLEGDSFTLIEVEFRNLKAEERKVEWKDFEFRSGGGRIIERPWGFRDDINAYWPYDSFTLSANQASMRKLLFAVERDAAVLHIRYKEEKPVIVDMARTTMDEYTDGRLTIRLDKIARSDQFPEDWRQPGQRYRKPQDGHDYVFVHFTVKNIAQGHVVCFYGRGDEKSILSGKSGTEYPLIEWHARGIRFLEPDDVRSGHKFVEGATGLKIFECPKEEEPANLSLLYIFSEDQGGEVRHEGNIDILVLPQINGNE